MHYVIFPCTCFQLLKFYRAPLLIEAISWGYQHGHVRGLGLCKARISPPLSLCAPFPVSPNLLPAPPHPHLSCFYSAPTSLFLFSFFLIIPPETLGVPTSFSRLKSLSPTTLPAWDRISVAVADSSLESLTWLNYKGRPSPGRGRE